MSFDILKSPVHLLIFLFVVTLLVAAHELGHYLFARLFRMEVEEFAIGFGPGKWVWKRKRTFLPKNPNDPISEEGVHDTIYTVRPFPLGGFVRIKGMNPAEDGSETQIPNGFYSKPPWQRILVLFAGPLFSVIAGYLVLIPLYSIMGIEELSKKPVIGRLGDGGAKAAGLEAGDTIVMIDGKPINTFFEITLAVRDHGEKQLEIVFERKGKRSKAIATPKLDRAPTPVLSEAFEPTGEMRIQSKLGIGPGTETVPVSFVEASQRALVLPFRVAQGILGLITQPNRIRDEAGGVVTIFMSTTGAFERGLKSLLELSGLLSISIGIFNLVPIGPLDGGQMLIAFAEMLRKGRRLSFRTQYALLGTGAAILLVFILAVTAFDIERWFLPKPSEKPPVSTEKPR